MVKILPELILHMPKILVVEDSETCWRIYRRVLVEQFKIPETDIGRAKYFIDASRMLIEKNAHYDLIFLDDRLPYKDPGCTKESNPRKYIRSLKDIGYQLLQTIKQYHPNSIVVGTFYEMRELAHFTLPELKLDKITISEELPKLMKEILPNLV